MIYIFLSAAHAKVQYKLKHKRNTTETGLEEMQCINYDEV